MNELAVQLRLLFRVFIFWISLCLLVWAVVPAYKTFSAGIILGSSASLLSSMHLVMRIQKLVHILASQQVRRFSLGFFTRIAIALIAVMIALRLDQFHLPATIIGLFYGPITSFVIAFFLLRQNHKAMDTRKEGE